MDRFDIQKLRELPIEAVAERLGLRVKKHRSLCPFHDDHSPSLYFNVRKNTYRCYACSAHGGVIDLALQLLPYGGRQGGGFIQACQWLANENNIILTEYKAPPLREEAGRGLPDLHHLSRLICQPHLNDEARHFLFDERRIHPDVVRWLGLSSISASVPMSGSLHGSWFNAPSLLIPYRDIESKLLTVQARYLGSPPLRTPSLESSSQTVLSSKATSRWPSPLRKSTGEGLPPRFQFPQGTTCHIFNQPILKTLRDGEDLWIAEGTSDCMALLSSGKKAIAIPSATLLNHNDMRLLSTTLPPSSKLHIYPDQDQAGETLYADLLRVATDLKRCLIRHDLPEGYKDYGEWWKEEAPEAPLRLSGTSPEGEG